MTDSTKSPGKAGGHRESSDEMSSLAATVLGLKLIEPVPNDPCGRNYNLLLTDAKRLAGSVLSQDEHKGPRPEYEPSAGTSAYQMLADAEKANLETTETLIHMVAATVLMKLVGMDLLAAEQAGEELTVELSPPDLDRMHMEYEMSAKRDGLISTISIKKRDAKLDDIVPPLPPKEAHLEDRPESLMLQDEPETAFEPQAEGVVYDRPLWAVRVNGVLVSAEDRPDAERFAKKRERDGDIATIENRFCYHDRCPAEHCNEVTSADS